MPGGLKRLWMLNRVNCDAAERPELHIGRCNPVGSPRTRKVIDF